MEAFINNCDLFMFMRSCESLLKYDDLYKVIVCKLTLDLLAETQLKDFCRKFCYNLHTRWVKSHRKVETFMKKNNNWLDSAISWPELIKQKIGFHMEQQAAEPAAGFGQQQPSASVENVSTMKFTSTSSSSELTSKLKSIRKPFENLSIKQKRRRTESIRTENTSNKLAFATEMRLKANGNVDIGKILDHLLKYPEDIDSMKNIMERKETKNVMCVEKALAMYVSLKLSRWQYITLRDLAKEQALTASNFEGALIDHSLLMTMIDGKITSYLSATSNQTCDICKAKPSEMNNLKVIKDKSVSVDIYKFGLSSLHAWIRCMECLLHIAYRLEFKQWSAKGLNKDKMAAKRKYIQETFRKETGLLIDIVKQGAGTTNDGNTARRFFEDPEKTASITGVDKGLINRFAIILIAISSGETISVGRFRQFALETLDLYVSLYHWYYMPASVHKLLVHGADIIEHFNITPIGKLSEEASEARNKDFRKFREHHSRKCSRKNNNEDILKNLLISSDPYISSLRPKMQRKKRILSDEVRALLILKDQANQENIEFVNVLCSQADPDDDSDSEAEDLLKDSDSED